MQALGAAAAVLVLFAGAGLLVGAVDSIPDAGYLTRDPSSVSQLPWWTGALSLLTNLTWAVAATVNLLASVVTTGRTRRSLLLLGGLCASLGIDDALQLHEIALPPIGIPEKAVLLGYALVGVLLAVHFWYARSTPMGAAFLAGVLCLGVSVATDVTSTSAYLLEDGAKLMGIVAFAFAGLWAFEDALQQLRSPEDSSRVRAA